MANMYIVGTHVSPIMDIFRMLFFFLDTLAYGLIPLIYSLIYSLYDINLLFNDGGAALSKLVSNLTVTIYSFLAIVMFFKVAISLLTMLVDPSLVEDKEKGAGKMVLNIAICLILIVVVPVLFRVAKDIQKRAMEEHWIEKMVIGDDFSSNEKYTLGNELALATWSVFLSPVSDDPTVNQAYSALFEDEDAIRGNKVWPTIQLHAVLNKTNGGAIGGNLARIFQGLNVNNAIHYDLSYVWLLSTITAIYVALAMWRMMIDIAYRSLKFFALELISPIAIISYIDPNSAKKGLFSKWSSEVMKTYLSLFIRIFVLAISAVLLRTFSLSTVRGDVTVIFTNLVYIIAIAAFIKNAPKLIDDLFGTSISKGSETKVGRELIGGLLGGAAVAAAGGISGAVVAGAAGKNGLKGAFSGAVQGAKKGFAAGKKGGFGGMVGVVEGGVGAVEEQRKKYGMSTDRDREKRIRKYEEMVADVDKEKGKAVSNLEANGEAKYKDLLRTGVKYNGRHYGQALDNDDRLKNIIKKNAGGLARDEMLHKGDAEYIRLRRLVYDQKNGEAMAQRTMELAQDDYQTNNSAYQNSTNKAKYITDFVAETRDKKIDLFVNTDDVTRTNMAMKELGLSKADVESMSTADLNARFEAHVKTKATVTINAVATMTEAQKDALFLQENGARIEATYGNSYGDINADAAKAKGDADAASKALEDYVKARGLGDIDSEYAIADSRHKAKEYEARRNQANNNNNNNTP